MGMDSISLISSGLPLVILLGCSTVGDVVGDVPGDDLRLEGVHTGTSVSHNNDPSTFMALFSNSLLARIYACS
jgi:hypothetical protein